MVCKPDSEASVSIAEVSAKRGGAVWFRPSQGGAEAVFESGRAVHDRTFRLYHWIVSCVFRKFHIIPKTEFFSRTRAWFEKGSGTFAGTARRVLRTKVPDLFSNHRQRNLPLVVAPGGNAGTDPVCSTGRTVIRSVFRD